MEWNSARSATKSALRSEFQLFRLLFKNSEEVKRTWFSQTRFVWVRDCITEHRGFVGLGAYQALSMVLCLAPSRAQGYRVK